MSTPPRPIPPVKMLPVQVFPRPCEGAEAFIARLAEANHLKPAYLCAHLCDPPNHRGTISWARLAAAAGRSLVRLQVVLEQHPPPSPPQSLCEYCGAPPKRESEPPQAPWWCTERCQRRSNLLISAPSSIAVLPGQKSTLSCLTCGTRFIRSTRGTTNTCSRGCQAKLFRTQAAEDALYKNPNAVEDDDL
ncbi:hypothetical protein ACIRPK_36475 [Kitasatospora sp. NPDC101801]|uniref:hypothetical protein n=1 Tax=Kitasatospora sp. NPDC101801 TaxID=3364103 RepID=UPI0037F2C665